MNCLLKLSQEQIKTKTFNDAASFKQYLVGLKTLPNDINRLLTKGHVDKMQEVISCNGFIGTVIVIKSNAFTKGKSLLYSGDAQHRKAAMLRIATEKLFGSFVVAEVEINDETDIINFVSGFNANAKNWPNSQYLKSFVRLGKSNYILLDKYLTRNFDIASIASMVEAFTGKRYCGHGKLPFKTGQFVGDEELAKEVLDIYKTGVLSGLHKCKASFAAFTRFYADNSPDFDKAQFLTGITKFKKMFGDIAPKAHYQKLYNLHCKIDKRGNTTVKIDGKRSKRRRFTMGQKVDIVEESFKDGVTNSQIAKKYNLSEVQFYNWKKQYKNGEIYRK